MQDTSELKALEDRQKLLEAEVEKYKGMVSSMVPKTDLAAAEKAAKVAQEAVLSAQAKLSQLESELAAAKNDGSDLAKKAVAAAADLSKAQKEAAVCEREVSQLKSSYKMADNDALNLRKRLEETEIALKKLTSRHSSEWLPHWLDESAGRWAQEGWTMVQQGTSSAIITWNTKVWPWIVSVASSAQTHGGNVLAQGTQWLKERGAQMPTGVQEAGDTLQRTIKSAASSEFVTKVCTGAEAAVRAVTEQGSKVVNELESFLVQAVKDNPTLAPLAQKPYSTFCVYFLIIAPVLALGMPLLASSNRSQGAPKKKKKTKSGATTSATATSSQARQQSSQGASVGSRRTPGGKKQPRQD